jgi:hypothetical protein
MSETTATELLPEVDAPEEAAEVPEGEVPAAAEGAAPTEPTKATKHKVPDGWATPIEALNVMKTQGLVPQDFPPQRMYGFVKSPGKTDPFPVKHFDAAGVQYDTAQLDEGGHTITRPGVQTDQVIEWWKGKGARDQQKAADKAAKAKAKAEKDAAAAAKAAATPAQATAEVPANVPPADGAEDVEAE